MDKYAVAVQRNNGSSTGKVRKILRYNILLLKISKKKESCRANVLGKVVSTGDRMEWMFLVGYYLFFAEEKYINTSKEKLSILS